MSKRIGCQSGQPLKGAGMCFGSAKINPKGVETAINAAEPAPKGLIR